MNIAKYSSVIIAAALSLTSASIFAQSVTATAQTLGDAEAIIASKAQQQGAQYTIIEASNNNVVHMTAKLHK